MYAVRLVIPDGFGPHRPQVVTESRKYTDEAGATHERDAWRLSLIRQSCNGLLEIRDSPGWLTLELVDYTDTPGEHEDDQYHDAWDEAMLEAMHEDGSLGWVMDTHEIWQRDVECRRIPCLPELHTRGYLDTPNLLVPESHKRECPYH